MDLITALKKIGFTQQEAVIYIELCHHHEMTGYEAAKQSGISRSNAYAALSNLVEKGYAHVIEEGSAKYTPVPKKELLLNARRDFEGTVNVIEQELDFTAHGQESYITVKGEKQIIHKLKNIITQAELRLYLSCDSSVLNEVANEVTMAADRGLKVVVLSKEPLEKVAHIHYYKEDSPSFKIIADTKVVLAGTRSQSIYSKNVTFVQLIREAFVNEIALIEGAHETN